MLDFLLCKLNNKILNSERNFFITLYMYFNILENGPLLLNIF